MLKNGLKDCKLSEVCQDTNCEIVAINRIDGRDVIFKSTDAILYKNRDFYMRDVGKGTAAAPTFFPSAEIKNI